MMSSAALRVVSRASAVVGLCAATLLLFTGITACTRRAPADKNAIVSPLGDRLDRVRYRVVGEGVYRDRDCLAPGAKAPVDRRRASGRPYREFLRAELFGPAGMQSTGFWGSELPPVPEERLARSYSEYNEKADKRSWKAALDFLAEVTK